MKQGPHTAATPPYRGSKHTGNRPKVDPQFSPFSDIKPGKGAKSGRSMYRKA